MATLGKIKSIDEYKKELGTPNVDAANKNIEQKRAADENTIIDYNSTIDDAAQATTNRYQQSIIDAPKLFEDQYDANHINELVAKKKIEERMANLGLAGSGLNRSQQTALAVQRGNADAATRRQQQDYVTAAQQAIDQVLAQAEADKATHANQLRGNTDTWAADLLARMAQADNENAVNAYNTGVEGVYSQYKTDTEAETAAAKLLHEAEQNALDREAENLRSLYSQGLTIDADDNIVAMPMSAYDQARIDSDNYWKNLNYQLDVDKHNLNVEKLNQSAVTDLTSERKAATIQFMSQGMDYNTALARAYSIYPDGVTDTQYTIINQLLDQGYSVEDAMVHTSAALSAADAYTGTDANELNGVMNDAINNSISDAALEKAGRVVEKLDLDMKSGGFFTGPEGDGKNVYNDIVNKQLKKNSTYLALTDIERQAVAATAIAESIHKTWQDEGEDKGPMKNYYRLKSAAASSGLGEDFEKMVLRAYDTIRGTNHSEQYKVGNSQSGAGTKNKTSSNRLAVPTSSNRLAVPTSSNRLAVPEDAQRLMG